MIIIFPQGQSAPSFSTNPTTIMIQNPAGCFEFADSDHSEGGPIYSKTGAEIQDVWAMIQ